jgi:ribosomal protein S18 acetylase RimI-like enzyme
VTVAIREFDSSDFDELWRIDQTCFAPGISYSRPELQRYIAARGTFTLIAYDPSSTSGNGAPGTPASIQGFIIGQKDARNNGHIITIDVRETAQRSGVGSLLMQVAEQRLRESGCRRILLEAAVDNTKALAFYKRHGYTVLKTIPRYYQNSVDAFLMGKRLD